MLIETGRPADLSERLPKEQRCYELLDSLGVEYLRVDHEAAMTMEAGCETGGNLPAFAGIGPAAGGGFRKSHL